MEQDSATGLPTSKMIRSFRGMREKETIASPVRASPGYCRRAGQNALTGACLPSTRATVYTRLSNPFAWSLDSGRRLPAGNESISGEDVAEGLVGCFGDADAWSDLNFHGAKAIVTDPQAGGGRG